MRKRTIYIDEGVDKRMRIAAVEDDKAFGTYAEEAFRLFLDKRRMEKAAINITRQVFIGVKFVSLSLHHMK